MRATGIAGAVVADAVAIAAGAFPIRNTLRMQPSRPKQSRFSSAPVTESPRSESEFSVLPGESLAKYSHSPGETEPEEEPEEEMAAPEGEATIEDAETADESEPVEATSSDIPVSSEPHAIAETLSVLSSPPVTEPEPEIPPPSRTHPH